MAQWHDVGLNGWWSKFIMNIWLPFWGVTFGKKKVYIK
jgi:hypothetical protein